jgi:hypothetical protein
MKKLKLIELLSKIEGNPDILLWNGYVGDYQDIDKSIVDQPLVRMKFDSYVRVVQYEKQRDQNDLSYVIPDSEIPELKKSYAKHVGWEINHFTSQDMLDTTHKSKTVFLMQPKSRGKRDWHRSETLEY